ncbi:hypothetical protein [Fusibacter sp. 3D3]|uniref:hypothetical protein n=1 Tax=Fusibacter sp. 3D3 TaxID=1048380 RepID=UPI0008536B9F|nr:hypothetical protein [Fusibacter sp. 3D3]GAU79240.1 hypothetical protein F3D3_3898 [Fusibacter sp. 3D3]
MRKIRTIITIIAITLISSYMISGASTNYANPNYEVKFYLKADQVLDSNYKLKKSVREIFDMPSSVTKMRVQYLDDAVLDLNTFGWYCRLRKKEDSKAFELTYKKRYPINEGDIEATLALAASEGFDAGEDDYEAQMDWGYSKQTLSFSNTKTFKDDDYSGMDLPNLKDSIKVAVNEAPGKFENWQYKNWGKSILEDSKIYGYVNAKRYIGTFQKAKTYIEVWEILNEEGNGYEYVVEISFKADDYETALSLRTDLKELLQNQNWLEETDILKTSMILNRY